MSEIPTTAEPDEELIEGPSLQELAAQYVEQPIVVIHGGDDPIRAVVLDADDRVVAQVLVPADYADADPATRWSPDGDGQYVGLLEDDEDPPVGARLVGEAWELPEPEPTPPPAPPTAQEQADAIVSLIFQAQSGVAPTPGFWAAVLAGMVDRRSASAETIDGALDHWRVITADEHAELRDRLEAAGGSAAPVEDLLDAAPRDA